MRSIIRGLFIIFLATDFLFSQNINISGTVTNSGGQPIEGAVVEIFATPLSAVTDGEGNYFLEGTTAAVGTHCQTYGQSIFYKNKSFIINVAKSAPASVKLFDMRGRLVGDIFSGILNQGSTTVPFSLDGLGNAMLLLHVTIGSTEATYTITPLASRNFTISAHQYTNRGLSKSAALDWIQASKTGYASSIQPIEVYNDVINFTLSNMAAPDFGNNVKIFDDGMQMSSIQSTMDDLDGASEMSSQRVAYFFKPGTYDLNVHINYYIQALGLGMSPDDVNINGEVYSNIGGLCAFWRGTENISVTPDGGTNLWEVSQAAPFRRMHIRGNMSLNDGGSTSGGFIADSKIDGSITSGSQQQFYTRNSTIEGWNGGVWNMVFHGTEGAPPDNWPSGVHTNIPEVPLVREKPFVIIDESGNYSVFVPAFRTNSSGTTWYNATPEGKTIPIDQFYIAYAGSDDAASINAALAQGKNLLLTPGIYEVTEPIRVLRPNTVVLGVGFPSIVSQNGNGGMHVADVDGVTIAGLMFDADGPTAVLPVHLRIGDEKTAVSHADNPICLFDIFCRIGGYVEGKVEVNVIINSNNVIFDHCWIWRGDHGNGVDWDETDSKNGMIINGDDVICYGQFMEHHDEYQTIWNGDRGRNYFLQCETPYYTHDWAHDGINGYAAYKVTDGVTTHESWGMGIYLFFDPGPMDNSIEVPDVPGVKMHHMYNFGNITHVINGVGSGKLEEYP